MTIPLSNNLPDIASARLPAAYERATTALAECSRIDECQEWANKAEAMASYARQSKDESLLKMATRIQARAIRRCGELLKQIEPAKNQHDASARVGTVPSTRTQAATNAGLSERQRKTALRVANIPEERFDEQIDSDSPPTVTKLSEQGKKSRNIVDLEGIDPKDYARATELQGTLRRFAEYCQSNSPGRIAQAFKPHEIKSLRECVATVDQWLDVLITSLPE